MARRKSPGTSKITRGTTAPKRAQRGSSPDVEATTIPEPAPQPRREILTDDVRRLAYEKFVARGFAHGNALGDWLAAEAELRNAAN